MAVSSQACASTRACRYRHHHPHHAQIPRLPLPLRALTYSADPRVVNIAVHFRIGDMQPTKEEWHVGLLNSTILPVLRAHAAPGTRLAVHIFMRADSDYKLFKRFPALPADEVAFHTADSMAPFPTFLHLTQADVLVQSRSAFSEYAGHVATRPLSFAADGSRFGGRYQQCGVGAVCCRDAPPAPPGSASLANMTLGEASLAEAPMCPADAQLRLVRLLRRRGLLRRGGAAGSGGRRLPSGLAPPAPAPTPPPVPAGAAV